MQMHNNNMLTSNEIMTQLTGFIMNGNLMKFYKSATWMKLRRHRLQIDNNECQRCKMMGKYSRAQCVHHIKEVKLFPLLALVISNLVSLCNNCHNAVHDRTANINRKEGVRFTNEERW